MKSILLGIVILALATPCRAAREFSIDPSGSDHRQNTRKIVLVLPLFNKVPANPVPHRLKAEIRQAPVIRQGEVVVHGTGDKIQPAAAFQAM
jgi:hypothetical protein